MKKQLAILMAALTLLPTFAFAGCGGGEKGDATLNVYVLNKGYKIEWFKGIKEAFVNELAFVTYSFHILLCHFS